MAQNRRDVGRDEELAVAHADHDRRSVAHGNDLVGILGGHEHDGEQAAQVAQGAPDGALQTVVLHLTLDEMRHDLRVRFCDEAVTLLLQFSLQIEVVLDDAVVNDDDVARAITMGVRVLFGRPAVGGPSCVPQPVLAVDGVGIDYRLQPRQLARASPQFDLAVVHQGHARGVVPAVFEPPEAVDEDGEDGPVADVADDAAHAVVISVVNR